jgi:hypothetical protein
MKLQGTQRPLVLRVISPVGNVSLDEANVEKHTPTSQTRNGTTSSAKTGTLSRCTSNVLICRCQLDIARSRRACLIPPRSSGGLTIEASRSARPRIML